MKLFVLHGELITDETFVDILSKLPQRVLIKMFREKFPSMDVPSSRWGLAMALSYHKKSTSIKFHIQTDEPTN
jgi:hypothetical protein